MRTHRTMTVSLPPEMVADIEKVRRTERRTRSELVREALRVYFDRIRTLPVYTPTRQELREIEKGRAEMRRGNYYTLDEFSRWLLGRPHKKSRAKTVAARPEA
ncbi:ribbon-helix-helix protein, CopG family [Candidatus Parcubacteria bacterium]|nr:ribbon-helix-helix protein, CopG family [Candidatus Parcubacteria bacterium]